MYDQIAPRMKPLWWEGLAGAGYALVAFSASALIFKFARDDGEAAWLWALLVGIIVAFLVGAVLFARWAGRHRRAARQRMRREATPPPSP
jgi:Flp pilus assembly protein TadB